MLAAARDRSLASGRTTIKQAAAMLGVSVRTVRRWEAAGKMPERSKHGRRKTYRATDVRALRAPSVEGAAPSSNAAVESGW